MASHGIWTIRRVRVIWSLRAWAWALDCQKEGTGSCGGLVGHSQLQQDTGLNDSSGGIFEV